MRKENTERSGKRMISYDTVVFHTFVVYIVGAKTVFTPKQNYCFTELISVVFPVRPGLTRINSKISDDYQNLNKHCNQIWRVIFVLVKGGNFAIKCYYI